jgi:hypothetical protein
VGARARGWTLKGYALAPLGTPMPPSPASLDSTRPS